MTCDRLIALGDRNCCCHRVFGLAAIVRFIGLGTPGIANFDERSRRFGAVSAASRTDADFTIERHSDGSLWFSPARTGVTMMLYSANPVADLTSIDRAPASGFGAVSIEAVPGYAYVFRVQKADGIHFAAARVAFTTSDYVVFDWSYQSGAGNVELNRKP